MEIASHTNESNNIYRAFAEGILGDAFLGEGNYQTAANHFRKALKVYENRYMSSSGPQALEMMGSLQMAAKLYLNESEYQNTKRSYAEFLNVRNIQDPDELDLALYLIVLGASYLDAGDLSTLTETLFKKALLVLMTKDRGILGHDLENRVVYDVATTLSEYSKFDMKQANKSILQNNIEEIKIAFKGLGDMYFARKDYINARSAYLKASKFYGIEMADAQLKEISLESLSVLCNLIVVYMKLKKMKDASKWLQYAQKSVDSAANADKPEFQELRRQMQRLETAMLKAN